MAGAKRKPIDCLVSGDWPDGVLEDCPEAVAVQVFSRRLSRAVDGLSLREVEERTGVTHATVANVLRGLVWPSGVTIARLEHGLQTRLWPQWPYPGRGN